MEIKRISGILHTNMAIIQSLKRSIVSEKKESDFTYIMHILSYGINGIEKSPYINLEIKI